LSIEPLSVVISEHAMTDHPKEQPPDKGHNDGKDKRTDDAPNADAGSPDPDSPAPILTSEDEELFDEDAPE
jgi:hypothetical protein